MALKLCDECTPLLFFAVDPDQQHPRVMDEKTYKGKWVYIQYTHPKCVHIPGRLRTVQVGQARGKVVQVGRETGGVAIATYRRRHALAFGILSSTPRAPFIHTHAGIPVMAL